MAPVLREPLRDAFDALLSERKLTADVLARASNTDFVSLLPLVLCTDPEPELIAVLQRRLSISRAAKLRFLLMRNHHALRAFPYVIRYSSLAYGQQREMKKRRGRSVQIEKVVEQVGKLNLLVDMLDLQSDDFFRTAVFAKKCEKDAKFGHVLITHPFPQTAAENPMGTPADSQSDSSAESLLRDGIMLDCDLAQCATLKESYGRAVLTLKRLQVNEENVDHEKLENLSPEIGLRFHDMSLKTAATFTLLRMFNSVWARDSKHLAEEDKMPFCILQDVLPVSVRHGLEVMLHKCVPLSKFKFDYWAYTKGLNRLIVDGFVRSAAGTYTAAYMLGLSERHGDEIGVTDGTGLYFRSVRGAFEHMSPPSSGHMTVSTEMRAEFQNLGVWDLFRHTCVRAFQVLRASHEEMMPAVENIFERAGVRPSRMADHVASKYALNLRDSDRQHADRYFRRWLS